MGEPVVRALPRVLIVPEHAVTRSKERVSAELWGRLSDTQIIERLNECMHRALEGNLIETWFEKTDDRGVVQNVVVDLDTFVKSAEACLVVRKLDEPARGGETHILVTVLTAAMKRRHITIAKWAKTPEKIGKGMQQSPFSKSGLMHAVTANARPETEPASEVREVEEICVVSWPDGTGRQFREMKRSEIAAFLSGLLGPHVREDDIHIYRRVPVRIRVNVNVDFA